jgi:hypothetical protein
METDFKYCIWLIFDKNIELQKLTNSFRPHISIKTDLEENEANIIFKKIKNDNKKFNIKLEKNIINSKENNFYALYFNVKLLYDIKPTWWPNDAHVSIKYNYNQPFSNEEINSINVKKLEYKTDDIIIMKCTGHHSKWIRINPDL